MLIDTHCHLAFKAFDDSWLEVVKRARDKDIQMIVVGAAKATSEKSIAIAEQSGGVFASVGLHPTHTDEEFDFAWFKNAADNLKVVAIGETGIDHYHIDVTPRHSELVEESQGYSGDPSTPLRSARDDDKKRAVVLKKQEDLLRQHLTIARDKKLPVILHSRDGKTESTGECYNHIYQVLTDFGYFNGVLHCYGGDWLMAKKFLDLGLMLSFTGIVTFKTVSESLKEVVRNVPLDRFMIETDSPYLAPEPERGKENEPAFVEHIARGIAEIRGVSYDEVARVTTENARKFFNI